MLAEDIFGGMPSLHSPSFIYVCTFRPFGIKYGGHAPLMSAARRALVVDCFVGAAMCGVYDFTCVTVM